MDRYVIIAPCFNEEKTISFFLTELETTLEKTNYFYTVIIVDDGSTDSTLEKLKDFKFLSKKLELKFINLKLNAGHQVAIKQGLKYAAHIDALGCIVMDSDGEDDPKAIIKLVEVTSFDIVFVNRGQRKESFSFKVGYFFYKIIFKVISGSNINFGNYSMISKKVLDSIYLQDYIHYAAFLSKLKYRKGFLKFDRRKRIDGKSKMNLNNLVLHGLKSLIEYSEELLFCFIRILVFMLLILIILGGYMMYSKFIGHDALLGWPSTILLGLINAILITVGIIFLGLLILSPRYRNKS